MSRAEAAQTMVLAYHEIMPQSNYAYCVTSDSFAQHLALLKQLGREGVCARVTFDDGEQSQQRNAVPSLRANGISATYFVNPALVGTEAKFLSWAQLRELQASGHSIQSHGHSHKFLNACTADELSQEVGESRKMLEDRLGTAVEELSIPGGRWDRRVIEACASAGYKRVFVSEPWIGTEILGITVIGRFMVRRTTTLAELEKMVRKDGRTLRRMRMLALLRQGVVGVVGDGLYHRLWCKWTGYNEFEAARQRQT
jgi:peptidoglycan/xylan/chitin deacetylase (PgdA/CDA1 family)